MSTTGPKFDHISHIYELLEICELEPLRRNDGSTIRKDLIRKWMNKNVDTLETTLKVVSSDVFTVEYMDFIKEQLIRQLVEDLTTYATFDIVDNKITARISLIRPIKRT